MNLTTIMDSIKELDFSTKESQITEKSLKLRDYGTVIEDVKAGRLQLSCLDALVDEVNLWIREGGMNLFDRMMSFHVLGHALNTKRCLTSSPEKADYNSPLVWEEVFCYRSVMRLASEVSQRRIIALYPAAIMTRYQADVHLGALYDHFGRFQEAQYLWLQAGHLNKEDYMWQFNIGFSLASTHGYYEKRTEPFVLAHAKRLLKPFLEKPETTNSAKVIYNQIKDWETPDLALDKDISYEGSEEGRYNKWVNDHWLRLNSYNDINPYSLMSQEDSLYFNAVFSPKDDAKFGYRMFSLLNEIKQEYVSARYMLYQYFTSSGSSHFSDKNVWLADNGDYSNYSFHIEVAKSAFRALYSILDKIAYSLNEYLGIGLNPNSVSFKDIWYSDKKKRTIRTEITRLESNYSLAGLLFIRNDIYGGDEHFLQNEGTIRLKAVRNAMEHRSIAIVDDGVFDENGLLLKISRADFEEIAMSLIRTVRQAIFCLVNMVNHIEYDKKKSIKAAGQMIIPQEISVVPDDDKV